MTRRALSKVLFTFRDPLFARPSFRWCVIGAASFLAGAWIAILGIPNVADGDAVIVHYTTTFGIDALGSWGELARLPLTGTALLIVNIGLAWFLARGEGATDALPPGGVPTAASVLLVASILLEFIVLIGCLLLFRANGGFS